ncbi:protein lifeguard 4-like [Leptinotarsa decemlineata]|uniref:protein lifeguard 4-like n=1 Tax=Leptinotarsa decemlineata TaxID=7539 RepID=UPI003D306048
MALTVGPFVENGRTYRMLSSPAVCGLALVVHTVYALLLSHIWTVLVGFLTAVALMSALYIKRRKSPVNLLVFSGFFIVQAYTIKSILSCHPHGVAIRALLLTLAALAGSSIYANRTKQVLLSINSITFVSFSIFIVGGLSQTFSRSTKWDLPISSGGALVFGALGIADTQRSLQASTSEEYVMFTINLYFDIINLLVYILRILYVTV